MKICRNMNIKILVKTMMKNIIIIIIMFKKIIKFIMMRELNFINKEVKYKNINKNKNRIK